MADNAKVEYSDQGGRQAPVTVRPLNENPSQADASSTGGPPRPQAAPTERVTRLAEVPPAAPAATPAAPASSANAAPAAQAPRTAALAERLNAPAPTAAAPAPTPLAPAPAPMTAAPKSVQPLIPSASSISSYDSDTVVIDGSGVRGGRKGVGQQLASAPRASFDPGNASVSSEVGTVSFGYGSSALSGKAKAMLADVAKLRAQVDGAIRIVGRGDQAQARAAAISRELRRLGVPSARLYDGGADNTLLGDEADIYVDY